MRFEKYLNEKESAWYEQLSAKAKGDPEVKANYAKWRRHMSAMGMWRTKKDKAFSKQDYKAGIQAKAAALEKAKKLRED